LTRLKSLLPAAMAGEDMGYFLELDCP